MAFKNVGLFENLISFEKDTSTEGHYKGKRVIESKDKKKYNVHTILNPAAVIEEFFGGQVSADHPEGSGSLDYLLRDIQEGDYIRVTYKGLTPNPIETQYGEKQIHQWKVEVDEDKKEK